MPKKSNGKSTSKSCKKGKIYKVGYTRMSKSGKSTYVKGNCIKATSDSGLKRSEIDKKYFEEKAKKQALARKLTRSSSLSRGSKNEKCAKGYIKRSAYIREPYERKSHSRTRSGKTLTIK